MFQGCGVRESICSENALKILYNTISCLHIKYEHDSRNSLHVDERCKLFDGIAIVLRDVKAKTIGSKYVRVVRIENLTEKRVNGSQLAK